jgi:hypothetical protein
MQHCRLWRQPFYVYTQWLAGHLPVVARLIQWTPPIRNLLQLS